MRSTVNWLLWTILSGCFVLMWTIHSVAAQRRTSVTVTRLFTGPDGQTHAGDSEVKLMASTTVAGEERSEMFKAAGTQFVRWSPGHVRDWHPPSHRRYAVTLSGRGEVELSSGQKMRLEPGRIILAEDLTGKGHITRTLGKEDWVFLLVPLGSE
jgi:quercetin dioxygenase-like cupin family protein